MTAPAAPASEAPAAHDFSLLPSDRSFRDNLPAFAFPYFAYVGLGTLLPNVLGPDLTQVIRFVVVAALLYYFRRSYRFGPRLTASQIGLGLLFAIIATGLWVATLRGALALPFWQDRLAAAEARDFSILYAVFRTAGSVLLVPVFEELLTRAFIPEVALAPRQDAQGRTLFDRHPRPLAAPPLTALTVTVTTLLFALGHDLPSLGPAVLYFLLTTLLYHRTRSFRLVILVHALTNLALAALVIARSDLRFLWF